MLTIHIILSNITRTRSMTEFNKNISDELISGKFIFTYNTLNIVCNRVHLTNMS